MNIELLNKALKFLGKDNVIFDMDYLFDELEDGYIRCCLGGVIKHLVNNKNQYSNMINHFSNLINCSEEFVLGFYTIEEWQNKNKSDYLIAKNIEDKEGMIEALENQLQYLIEKEGY